MTATASPPREAAKMGVRELVRAEKPSREAIAAALQALDHRGRVAALLTLGAKEQARLFEVAAENAPLEVADMLAKDAPAGVTAIWDGVNSLPLFRRFEKRVTRASADTLAGYNEQAMKWLTGPGCFTVRKCREDEPGSIVFDYTITPREKPTGCARVKPADKGLSRFVYGGMLDYMHRVSDDVVIGRAWKWGKATDNYFLLARGPVA